MKNIFKAAALTAGVTAGVTALASEGSATTIIDNTAIKAVQALEDTPENPKDFNYIVVQKNTDVDATTEQGGSVNGVEGEDEIISELDQKNFLAYLAMVAGLSIYVYFGWMQRKSEIEIENEKSMEAGQLIRIIEKSAIGKEKEMEIEKFIKEIIMPYIDKEGLIKFGEQIKKVTLYITNHINSDSLETEDKPYEKRQRLIELLSKVDFLDNSGKRDKKAQIIIKKIQDLLECKYLLI